MDPFHTELLLILNVVMAGANEHLTLSKLPSGSWQAGVSILNDILTVDILRNDANLRKHNWVEMADPIQWFPIFVPPIARTLAQNKSLFPLNMKVIFRVKSESEEWRGSCLASNLVELFKSGEVNDFGSMMTKLDIEVIKYE